MKAFVLIVALVLTSCGIPDPVKPEIDRDPADSPAAALKELVRAQDNFFSLSGRFSMNLDPLVERGFLSQGTASIFTGKHPFNGWKFEPCDLPFPDEDVSWCQIARGPDGIVLLGAYTGVWKRSDNKCPLDKASLPPAAPWTRIN